MDSDLSALMMRKGVSTYARALGFQKDGWSCGYELSHLSDEVVGHSGSLEDIDVILTCLPKKFIREAWVFQHWPDQGTTRLWQPNPNFEGPY